MKETADAIETNNLTFAEIYAKRWNWLVQYFTISVNSSFSLKTIPTVKPQKIETSP